MMMRRVLIVGVVLTLVAGVAHAQLTVGPQVKKAGEIAYISGGVGKPEREQLQALEKEFNLKLVFAQANGKYVANVRVVVSDAKGRKLLEHVANGPFFMARLPAGEYSIAATFAGSTQTRKVEVAANRLRTEILHWSGTQ